MLPRRVPSTQEKTFLWNHKEWILAGTVISLLILKIVHYIRNRPQYPIVETKFSLHKAILKISMPKEEPIPPNVILVFAVDVSGSMKEEGRAELVLQALDKLVADAQQAFVEKNANIHFAVTVFDLVSKVCIKTTKISSDPQQKQEIHDRIARVPMENGTDFIEGLEGGTQQLEAMVKANRHALPVLTYLTDGLPCKEIEFDEQKLAPIRLRLAALSAQFFVLGIGEKHDATTLLKMTAQGSDGFKGTYINTASGQDSIGSAIAKIYQHAISSFRGLEITAPGLDAKDWSIHPKVGGQSNTALGSLSEGTTLTKQIVIHTDQLLAPLDLATVKFKLTFTDPKGRQGEMTIPWKPHSIIDPEIIKPYK